MAEESPAEDADVIPPADQVPPPAQVIPVSASGEAAEALTADRVLRTTKLAPSHGWRRAVFRASAGLWNPGESPAELERRDLVQRMAAPVTGRTRTVAVISRKGGVGKTTTTVLLGQALGLARQDRVVALDANPDRGTLADRVPRQGTATVWDVAAASGQSLTFSDMSALVSRDTTRLDVIASAHDPQTSRAFNGPAFDRVSEVLRQHYAISLVDCGTDFTHDGLAAVLAAADAVVVVAAGAVDEARLASETLDVLTAMGHARLAREAVVVLQSADPARVNVTEIGAHFTTRCRAFITVPRDPHLAEGSVVEHAQLSPATRRAATLLAASVVDLIQDPK